MSDTLAALLFWAAPPLVGAIIGFVTNAIAIRMLFRPLTEKRLLGIRVPFTPGIIPRQRKSLAASIGRMVSDELLTEDAVRAQVESPKVQEALRSNIAGLTDSLLGLRLESLRERRLPIFNAALPDILRSFIDGFFKSPVCAAAAEGLVGGLWDSIGARPARAVAGELDLERFLDERIAQFIESDGAREKIAAAIVDWSRRRGESRAVAAGEGGARDASDPLLDMAAALFRSLLPHVLDALRSWLNTPDVRRGLEVKGKLLLDDILSKLNIFQRFFVSVGQYDATLSGRMPEIVDDFIARAAEAVGGETEREAIVAAFGRALAAWRARGLAGSVETGDGDGRTKARIFIDRVFDFLKKEKASRRLADAAGAFFVSRGDESIARLAESLFGVKKEHAVKFVRERLADDSFRSSAAHKITEFALGYLETQGRLSLGEVLGVDAEKKAAFDEEALAALNGVLAGRLPEALKSLDLRGLVENKINSLDIKAVEGLLLMVIARQLKWINVFGAVLGALIGVLQVVLRLLGIG